MQKAAGGSPGVTIVAAFVFALLLSGMAVAIGIGNIAPSSQTAQVYAALPPSSAPTGSTPSAGAAKPTDTPAGAEQQQCQPGDEYTIKPKASTQPTQTAAAAGNGSEQKEINKKKGCEQTDPEAKKKCQKANPQCKVTWCDASGQNCKTITFNPGDPTFGKAVQSPSSLKEWASQQKFDDLKNTLLNSNGTPVKDLASDLSLGDAQNKALSDAFKQQIDTAQAQVQQNTAAIDQLKQYISQCNTMQEGTGCYDLTDKVNQQKALEAQNAQLQDRLKNLKDAQVVLGPGTTPTPQPDPRKAPSPGPGDDPNRLPPPPGPGAGPPGPGGPGTSGFTPVTGTGGGGGLGNIGSLLSGIGKMLSGYAATQNASQAPASAPAQPCSTDPNIYAQQQRQYQDAQQQYNYQLQQYQYQQQMNQYNSYYYGSAPQSVTPPVQPSACTPSTGQQCANQPTQPPASACTVGFWKPNYSGVCISGWQCVSSGPVNLEAQLSCQPQVVDVGMSLAMAFSCSSGTSQGQGFDTGGVQSGSASTTVAAPPPGANTATYGLVCTDQGKTASAQCSIQIAKNNIVLVANPKSVPVGQNSLVGWITTGMQSCVISSPDQPDFTQRNSSNTSVNGTATSSPVLKNTLFTLNCQTLAGQSKSASVTVTTK